MPIFRYDIEKVRTWANGINNLISGDGDSFRAAFNKFVAQMQIMVEPGTWTGSAAQKNFQNMDETFNTMVRFSNTFGTTFTDAIKSINDQVANLEISNLGTDTNVSGALNSLEYINIKSFEQANVQIDKVTYDPVKLATVTAELNTILNSIDNIHNELTRQLDYLDNGTGIWDGELAYSAKSTLTSIMQSNLTSIMDNLRKCISNVELATEAARQFDSSMGNSFASGAQATTTTTTTTAGATGYANPGEAMAASLQGRGVTHEQSVAMENASVTGSYYGPASSQQQASVETLSSTNANMGSVSSMGPGAGLTDEMRRQAIAEDNARVASEALANQIFNNNN